MHRICAGKGIPNRIITSECGTKVVYSFVNTFWTVIYFLVLTHFCPPFPHLLSERLTSLGIMGEPRVPPLNPSETIVL